MEVAQLKPINNNHDSNSDNNKNNIPVATPRTKMQQL